MVPLPAGSIRRQPTMNAPTQWQQQQPPSSSVCGVEEADVPSLPNSGAVQQWPPSLEMQPAHHHSIYGDSDGEAWSEEATDDGVEDAAPD